MKIVAAFHAHNWMKHLRRKLDNLRFCDKVVVVLDRVLEARGVCWGDARNQTERHRKQVSLSKLAGLYMGGMRVPRRRARARGRPVTDFCCTGNFTRKIDSILFFASHCKPGFTFRDANASHVSPALRFGPKE